MSFAAFLWNVALLPRQLRHGRNVVDSRNRLLGSRNRSVDRSCNFTDAAAFADPDRCHGGCEVRKQSFASVAIVLVVLCFGLIYQKINQRVGLPGTLPPIEIYFSPHGGCTEAVVQEINAAKTKIRVQAYSFTSEPIAKALVDAHKRGVQIEVILDESQESEKYSSADFLLHAGIPTQIDSKHAIAHNKVMVFDDATVITGSFNFTSAAEKSNAENLLIIRDPQIAAKYTANWQNHAAHSEPYTGPKSHSEKQEHHSKQRQ
jgi:phosphatidylserine/phosphatidylglycerophosphate/cardiolipin synthase-like enzyme